jgi:FlaG/FlaF family flagellin (archaellin)
MPNFVDDLTSLSYPKLTSRPTAPGQEDYTLRAGDWNELCQAAVDLRGAVLDLRDEVDALGEVSVGPYVDLRAEPYNLVADDSSLAVRAANTAGLRAAMVAYNGTDARLTFGSGSYYFDKESGQIGSIRFGSSGDRMTKVHLVGQGPGMTRLVQHGEGNGGDWSLMVVDYCTDCSVRDLTVEQGTIDRPDPGQQNHLIELRNSETSGSLYTERIDFVNVSFGKCIGDAFFHRAGSTYPVRNVRLLNFRMNLNGVCIKTWAASTAYALGAEVHKDDSGTLRRYRCITAGTSAGSGGPTGTGADITDGTAHWEYKSGGPRLGARSGISFQGGYNNYEIANGVMYGAQNSLVDMEASAAGMRDGVYFHDLLLDHSFSNSAYAISAGSTATAQAKNLRFQNVKVFEGIVQVLYVDSIVLDDVTVSLNETLNADPTIANLVVRNTVTDLRLVNLDLQRNAGTAGYCLDIQGAGNMKRHTIDGGRFIQNTATYPILIDGVDKLTIKNEPLVHYKAGSGASSYPAVMVQAVSANADEFSCESLRVVCDTGTMRAALEMQGRAPRTMNNIAIRGVRCAGEVTDTVIIGIGAAATVDLNPIITDCDKGSSGATLRQVDASDATITTVIPIVGGNRGGAKTYEGTGAPSFSAARGSLYLRNDGGATTTLYVNTDGATAWTTGAGTSYEVDVTQAPYNATGDGATDDRAAIQAAINAVIAAGGGTLYFPPGTYKVGRNGANAFCLDLNGCRNVAFRGEPGKSRIKHPDDVAAGLGGGTNAYCRMLWVRNCWDLDIEGLIFDGNWGQFITAVKVESDQKNLASLPSNTLHAEDTTGFPSSGSFKIVTRTGAQLLTYTGKTATTFTGVSAGTGILREGDKIILADMEREYTAIAVASNGATLPQATINVDDTSDLPASGTAYIETSLGIQTVTYTGKTATTLTGCAGGTGVMSTGGTVLHLTGDLNQDNPKQIDARNTLLFIYGSDGTVQTENKNITIRNCRFEDAYGDFAWVGAWSYNVKFVDCYGDRSARNGFTISNFAEGVHFTRCYLDNVLVTAVDCEPVEGPVHHVTIDDCDLNTWANPYRGTGVSPLSIAGGTVGRPAEWNLAMHWRVTSSRIRGSALISGVRDIKFDNCFFHCDYGNANAGPVVLYGHCDDVSVENSYIVSRVTPANHNNFGCVNIRRYDTNSNSSTVPGNITVRNCTIKGRNGVGGVYIEPGGYGGATGTATALTAASAPSTAATLTDAGETWDVNYWAGHQVLMGGVLANIISNTADTLTLGPLFENYTQTSWADARGNPAPAPSLGVYVIKPIGARIHIDHNRFDLVNDGDGAGSFGVKVDGDSSSVNWNEGYEDARVSIKYNDTRGATGPAIHVVVPPSVVSMKEIEIIGNHAWDDQPTRTMTSGVLFENADLITYRTVYGNTVDSGTTISGLTSGSWKLGGGYPESWAGYEDPNGEIFAPPASTYQRLNSNVIYLKESPVTASTGWTALKGNIRANIRDIGTQQTGTGDLNMTGLMPASVDGDIELLFINTTYSSATAGADATLSTPARFVKKASATSNYSSNTIVNRAAIWWRRKQPGDVAPVIADSGDFNQAVVVAVKDCIGYGDPFDFAPVATTNTSLSLAVTATGGTTVSDGALFGVFLTWFIGGTTRTVSGWANADADLTEEAESFQRSVQIGSDRVACALFLGRTETAATIGNTTATLDAESYALWTTLAFALKPAQVLARASGTITCVAKASLVDGDYLTIGDGMSPAKLYEFDLTPNGVTAGRIVVDVSADTSAAQVAARLRTAILANQPSLGVTDNGDGTLSITHNWAGSGGNVAMTENVTNAGFTVSGLSGGQG